MAEDITSPDLGGKYLIADNRVLIEDTTCPIDGTNIIWVVEYDFSHYRCPACETIYQNKDPKNMQERAKKCMTELQGNIDNGNVTLSRLPRLERILEVARKNGVVE
jgi:hypothetical protein